MGIEICLKARNSSGEQSLHFDADEDGLHVTITGQLNGEYLQLDFDPLCKADADDLLFLLQRRIAQIPPSPTIQGEHE